MKKAARERCFLLKLNSFLGGGPAILDERLPGELRFVYSQAEDVLFFLQFHRKRVDEHTLFPESGNDFARQSGTLRYPKLKLSQMRHDVSYTYEARW